MAALALSLRAKDAPCTVTPRRIHMLTLLGGRQRTEQDYEALLADAGFVLEREIDTRAGISILEAVAA